MWACLDKQHPELGSAGSGAREGASRTQRTQHPDAETRRVALDFRGLLSLVFPGPQACSLQGTHTQGRFQSLAYRWQAVGRGLVTSRGKS